MFVQLSKSIEDAQKTCEEDPTSAPCAVAWDEVEELHAEASHQRDKKKTTSDPLEAYCNDNPETDECRVYEDQIVLSTAQCLLLSSWYDQQVNDLNFGLQVE